MLAQMLALAAAFQVGPFYEQRDDGYHAVRPFYSHEGDDTDILWPLYTEHRDWWRALMFIHNQDYPDGGFQFEVLPFFWCGREAGAADGERGGDYWGLFPLCGKHPHFLLMTDLEFSLWPVFTRYKMPRGDGWMTSTAVFFPFVHWRDDGSFGVWPLYGLNHQRESDHRYALWPLVTWAEYREDRDTAGEGYSWMVLPLYGEVRRAREEQTMVLPPFFSFAKTFPVTAADRGDSAPDFRIRCPWPFFELEHSGSRDRVSVWPFYENSVVRDYRDGSVVSEVTRFGWKLVELYDDETRVFPFWVSRKDDSYFRLWPFWESSRSDGGDGGEPAKRSRFLCLLPIRWSAAVDRNWAKFWTFYEREETKERVHHSLLWGIIQWDD